MALPVFPASPRPSSAVFLRRRSRAARSTLSFGAKPAQAAGRRSIRGVVLLHYGPGLRAIRGLVTGEDLSIKAEERSAFRCGSNLMLLLHQKEKCW